MSPDRDFLAQPGHLYVCATPIGNLGDLSPRAQQVLAAADLILAEDTRRSRKLSLRLPMKGRLVSCHAHNERARINEVVAACRQGQIVALVTDAGTPGVSDPGSRLVAAVAAGGYPVIPVPGPSAVATALSVSGFSADAYQFLGFFPRQQRQQEEMAQMLALQDLVTVFFESPNRIGRTVAFLAGAFPRREAFLGREMTKRHETYYRGTLAEIAEIIGAAKQKGEFTLVLGPAVSSAGVAIAVKEELLLEEVRLLTRAGLPELEAIRRVARGHDLPRQAVYRIVHGKN